MKKIILGILALVSAVSFGQEKEYKAIDANLQLKSMHLWRGGRVTDAALSAATLAYTSKDGKFQAGFWGGYSFNGKYTEFDNFISYSSNGFTVALWDINNFSNYPNAKFFNYSHKGSRFVDLTLAYQLQNEAFPLKLSWNTIIAGRDFYEEYDANGKYSTNSRLSTYVEATFPLVRKDSFQLYGGLAGAFALTNGKGQKGHFYYRGSESGFNVVNIFLQYSKNVTILQHTIPFSVYAMYNPSSKQGGLQIAANLF